MNLDQQLGSLIEAWYTRDVPDGHCQFCNEAIDGEPVTKGAHEYCDDSCRDDLEQVLQARLVIGERDLEQRGYD
jgi:hypothetical protein